MATYDQIHGIETELCRYRKGSLAVCIDMDRGLIVWKDSNHWVNDFTRSLDLDTVQTIREKLAETGILKWRTSYESEEAAAPSRKCTWSLVIKTPERNLKRHGVDRFPPQWDSFRALIEDISRTSFDL
ncbi:MAG: hypothetical protein KBA30_00860 [Clostridia bacterium]|nr:hypothetical protein [Clostridia bacterium]